MKHQHSSAMNQRFYSEIIEVIKKTKPDQQKLSEIKKKLGKIYF